MEVDGTSYTTSNLALISVLEWARLSKTRVVIEYGKDWTETGYISRSCGPVKVPICLYNNRSMGGAVISDSHIRRVLTSRGKQVLYVAA
jgi:hypothetical protein